MSNSKNQHEFAATAIGKLDAFCSAHSFFNSDEELRDSFDSFLVGDHAMLENAAREKHHSDFKAIEEILPVLYELGDQLVAGKSQCVIAVSEQTDPSNRLYASLKRHPE